MDVIIEEDIKNIVAGLQDEFRELKGRTILISGANGFVPAYFVDTVLSLNNSLLSDSPAKVIALVRRQPEECHRLQYWLNNPNLKFHVGDVTKLGAIKEKSDFIIHAASKASPKDYLSNPLDTIDANSVGTRALLEYAKEQDVKGFLFVSSGEVYGDPAPESVPIKETYAGQVDPIGPRSSLQEAKRFGETLCYNFHLQFGTPTKIARLFHTYGPRLSLEDGRVIPEFMRRGLESEDLEITRAGQDIRTFAYISDTIQGLWRVLLKGNSGEAYNIGSAEEVSVSQLAEMFVELFEGKMQVKNVGDDTISHLQATPQRTRPSIEKAQKDLGYKPKVKLQDGLKRLKQWYEKKRAEVPSLDTREG